MAIENRITSTFPGRYQELFVFSGPNKRNKTELNCDNSDLKRISELNVYSRVFHSDKGL